MQKFTCLIILLFPSVQCFMLGRGGQPKENSYVKSENDLHPRRLLAQALQFYTASSKCTKTLSLVTSVAPNNLKEKPPWTYKCKIFHFLGLNLDLHISVFSVGCVR